jgi:hypothetical protein
MRVWTCIAICVAWSTQEKEAQVAQRAESIARLEEEARQRAAMNAKQDIADAVRGLRHSALSL